MRYRCISCSPAMVDAIVQLRDGCWGTIEIKLGEGQVDDAATNLKRFAEQIDSQRSGSPAFLAVICGKGYGYRRAQWGVRGSRGCPWALAPSLSTPRHAHAGRVGVPRSAGARHGWPVGIGGSAAPRHTHTG
jgi:hypothetical protein